jgi:hypothetical protein
LKDFFKSKSGFAVDFESDVLHEGNSWKYRFKVSCDAQVFYNRLKQNEFVDFVLFSEVSDKEMAQGDDWFYEITCSMRCESPFMHNEVRKDVIQTLKGKVPKSSQRKKDDEN